MGPSSPACSRRLGDYGTDGSAGIPELAVPDSLVAALDADRDAGVDFAYQMVSEIRASGAFQGVHLIPVSRYREIAARLERL